MTALRSGTMSEVCAVGENGFIRDMLDVKVLILYVMDLAEKAMNVQDLYALCYQDDRLTYFDVCEAVPQLVKSGHLLRLPDGLLEITEKGRENVAITGDSVAFPVRERAKAAVEAFNRSQNRSSRIRTEVVETDNGFCARMELHDDAGKLFGMEVAAPNRKQAKRMEQALSVCAERLYATVMDALLEETE